MRAAALALVAVRVRLDTVGLGAALGYDNQISNRVVDAIGDVSGGVRLNSPTQKGNP